jgi:hypothetical protein
MLVGEVVVVRWGDEQGYEFKVRNPELLVRVLDPQGRVQVKV